MGDQEPQRWTEERIARLRELWVGGSSAGQIALEMGGITRNTVIGKLDRLGLLGNRNIQLPRAPASPPVPRPTPPARPRQATPGPDVPSPPATTQAGGAATRPPMERTVTRDGALKDFLPRKVTIMELGADMCRWPLGDPSGAEFRYCGNASNAGQPYCPYHAVMAYEPPRQRSGR